MAWPGAGCNLWYVCHQSLMQAGCTLFSKTGSSVRKGNSETCSCIPLQTQEGRRRQLHSLPADASCSRNGASATSRQCVLGFVWASQLLSEAACVAYKRTSSGLQLAAPPSNGFACRMCRQAGCSACNGQQPTAAAPCLATGGSCILRRPCLPQVACKQVAVQCTSTHPSVLPDGTVPLFICGQLGWPC